LIKLGRKEDSECKLIRLGRKKEDAQGQIDQAREIKKTQKDRLGRKDEDSQGRIAHAQEKGGRLTGTN